MDFDPTIGSICRTNPTSMIFLVDQSNSMANPFGRQPEKKKAEGVAEILNGLLYNLTIQCTKGEGIYDYLHLGVIGYGAQVGSVLQGPLAGRSLVTIGELGNNPFRIQDQTAVEKDFAGRDVVIKRKQPIWIEPAAKGKTPLTEALTLAKEWVEGFIGQFQRCFPPLVVNLTDGQPSTDPRPQARSLCEVKSLGGHVLLFNVHISEQNDAPIEFPARKDELPDKFARFLFELSSVLPSKFVEMGQAAGLRVEAQSRGFVFNADLQAVHKFLDFGTKTQANPGTFSSRNLLRGNFLQK